MVLSGLVLFASLVSSQPVHALTAADHGKTIHVAKGDRIIVTLESNASTGFKWQVENVPNDVVQGGPSVYAASANPGVPGAAGTETFSFSIEGRPKGKLRLEYVRPWHEKAAPDKVFEVTFASDPAPKTVVYAGEKSVSVHVGEILVVPFKTSAGTAGVATVVRVPKFLRQLPDEAVENANGEKNVGGPLTVNLRFKAVKSGRGALQVVVRSPGQPDAPLVSTVVRTTRKRRG